MKRLLSEKNSGYVYVQFSRKNDASFLSIRGNEPTPLNFFSGKIHMETSSDGFTS